MKHSGKPTVEAEPGSPLPLDWEKVERMEDLTPAVELYDKLIGLERYDDARVVFRDHLDEATLYRLSANRLRAELLERLFPDGVEALPWLQNARDQGNVMNALALAYKSGGEPGRSVALYRRAVEICERENDATRLVAGLVNMAHALWQGGCLREAGQGALRALRISQEQKNESHEGSSLLSAGITLAAAGDVVESLTALRRTLNIRNKQINVQGQGYVSAWLAQRSLWLGQAQEALSWAGRAWDLAPVARVEADFIRAARLHGEAALALGDAATAEERLHHALSRARAVNLTEEELPTLTALAELHRKRTEHTAARELLEQVWAPAERGPYPLWRADARNVLARIDRDERNREAAIAAARGAYELAWCDGPPYAYHFGLTNARALLAELGAAEPVLPAFDESKFEPMPDVEINPKDESWVDPASFDPPMLDNP